MEPDNGLKKSPYKGIFLLIFLLIIVPVVLSFLFYKILNSFQPYGEKGINLYSAIFLGYGVGFLFQMACVIAGLFKGSFKVVVKRVVGFFDNVRYSFKMAVKLYIDDVKEDGLVFWIMFFIILATLGVTLFGLYKYICIM